MELQQPTAATPDASRIDLYTVAILRVPHDFAERIQRPDESDLLSPITVIGTGFLADTPRMVLTAKHVVENSLLEMEAAHGRGVPRLGICFRIPTPPGFLEPASSVLGTT